jgi:hypothetical protein
MAGTVYYNTKTSATAEFTKKQLSAMKPEFRPRWREASESEIALHEKRKKDQALIDSKEKERKKAKAKADKAKEAKLKRLTGSKEEPTASEDLPTSDNTGSDESGESEGSK